MSASSPSPPPSVSSPAPSAWRYWCGVLHAYLLGHEYRGFRRVVAARMIFQGGCTLVGLDALYMVEDLFGVRDAPAQALLARIAITSIAGALLVAMPAGAIADRVGVVPCVVVSTVMLSGVLISASWLPDPMAAQHRPP